MNTKMTPEERQIRAAEWLGRLFCQPWLVTVLLIVIIVMQVVQWRATKNVQSEVFYAGVGKCGSSSDPCWVRAYTPFRVELQR